MSPWRDEICDDELEISVVRTPSLCFAREISLCRPAIFESRVCCCSHTDWPSAEGTPNATPQASTRANRGRRRRSRTRTSFAGHADVPARACCEWAGRSLGFTGQNRFAPSANRSGLLRLVPRLASLLRFRLDLRLRRRGLLRLGSGLVRSPLPALRRHLSLPRRAGAV